ncbi:hypothetical protein F4802DRAFT_612451 [Xylaria palmicola]|nr:hypothetical protein F4802DRAFT_612451 [Xylaria palmicola]
MKIQTAVGLCGLIAGTGVLAQRDDDIPTLIADGPFALRVKGRACNSSIDGYLHAVSVYAYTGEERVLHYEALPAPVADNSSYQFYFNHTGRMQSRGHELGFLVSDLEDGEPNAVGLRGRAMSLQYRPNTNVALPVFGAAAGTVDLAGFDGDRRAFYDYYTDDAESVPGRPANVSRDINYYNWAVCWQTYNAVTGPSLSWITAGKPHNPTCEPVDLLRADL